MKSQTRASGWAMGLAAAWKPRDDLPGAVRSYAPKAPHRTQETRMQLLVINSSPPPERQLHKQLALHP